jgi:hypothetical protein
MALELGNRYTRREISALLGGDPQSFMPKKGGRATCVCIDPTGNPAWPRLLLITQPEYLKHARQFAQLAHFVPWFLKRRPNGWEYVGDYRASDSTEDRKKLAKLDLGAEKRQVLLALFLEKRGGNEYEAEAESFDAQERAAGFQSNPEIRRAVEQYAMKRAKEKLPRLGFSDFDDTSRYRCFDYTCRRGGDLYYVEVKGTQGSGASVILTKNEIEHARKHQQHSIFVIVHGVNIVSTGGSSQASGGTSRVYLPWILESGVLEPIQYKWTLPALSELPAT